METEKVVTMADWKDVSVLGERIANGKADPISDEERSIVALFRADYEKKYGRGTFRAKKLPRTTTKQTKQTRSRNAT